LLVAPSRIHRPTGADDPRIGVSGGNSIEPPRLGSRVVVDERDNIARDALHAGVPSAGEPRRSLIRNASDPRELVASSVQQVGVVIDHDHELEWRRKLFANRRDGFAERAPARARVRTENHADARPRPIARRRLDVAGVGALIQDIHRRVRGGRTSAPERMRRSCGA